MSAPKRKKCSSESGRHTWMHCRNKVVKTQTLTTIHLSEKGVYSCLVCNLAKYGAPIYQQKEGVTE